MRSIWLELTAVAVTPQGAVGGSVSSGDVVVALATFEYGPWLLAASVARTRYWYVVPAVSPGSEYVVLADVPTWAKFAHAAPWQRSTR